MIHDVIVVGAGPGGSSVATLLAERGLDVLVLDRDDFPRDKVCGDGLTPQAIYWCDRLGCVDEVLAQTRGVIRECDLYIGGRHILAAGFNAHPLYPDFAVLLDRRRLDATLLRNAVRRGARFLPHYTVRAIEVDASGVTLRARTPAGQESLRARLVVGADGVTSVVSRALGNRLKDGVTAVSVRTYYRGVRTPGARMRVHFHREYFPGYGWLFVDDDGLANVGVGYAVDPLFPTHPNLGEMFRAFVGGELADVLGGAERCAPIAGGHASFHRSGRIVGDRVLLVGDAANDTDPLNGGGIHKAMESAHLAAPAVLRALSTGDCTASGLALYEDLWRQHVGCDWGTAELLLNIAKNPHLRDLLLFSVEQVGALAKSDAAFREFCSGVYSGTTPRTECLSPQALLRALPVSRAAWATLLRANGDKTAPLRLTRGLVSALAGAGAEFAYDPLPDVNWGLEVVTKALGLLNRHVVAWGHAADV